MAQPSKETREQVAAEITAFIHTAEGLAMFVENLRTLKATFKAGGTKASAVLMYLENEEGQAWANIVRVIQLLEFHHIRVPDTLAAFKKEM